MSKITSDKKIKAISLFSSAGIGEAFLDKININVVVANELLHDRASLYQEMYKDSEMISGDILSKKIFNEIVKKSGKVDLIIATPPCQGMSVAGKNRELSSMHKDNRNLLVFKAIELIKIKKPKLILFENVPNFLKIKLPYKGHFLLVEDILKKELGDSYVVESSILDSSDYGVPQKRIRAIIKAYKKGVSWSWPTKETKKISVKEAIGDLPTLEAGEKSKIKWHFARKHSDDHVLWMRHTPSGKTAFDNKKYYPNKSGKKIKSYNTSYRRIAWNEPSPTITMRNDAISSQLNVHPGRKKNDGTYSDARVLTPLELMILSSLPKNFNIPQNTPEILLRKCLGECVPPLLIKKVLEKIKI